MAFFELLCHSSEMALRGLSRPLRIRAIHAPGNDSLSRFQRGSIFKRVNKVWVARWWEDSIETDGTTQRLRRSEILGAVSEIPTRRQGEQLLADRGERI